MMPPRFAVVPLIVAGMRVTLANLRVALDLALVPTMISVALTFVGRALASEKLEMVEALAIRAVDVVPSAMFAVAWYRFVLLGPAAVGAVPGLSLGTRERAYLFQFAAIAAIPILLEAMFLAVAPWPLPKDAESMPPGMGAAAIVGLGATVTLLIAVRLSPGLVAPALDLAWTPRLSWRYGAGNGWAILGALLLTLLGLGIGKAMVGGVVERLATGLFDAPLSLGPLLVVELVQETVAYLTWAPVLALQAFMFRDLTGYKPGHPLRQPPV